MEITNIEIAKISKKFKIPAQDIINFLAQEEKLEKLEKARSSFLSQEKLEWAHIWLQACYRFCDYEEFYVIGPKALITEKFFIDWLSSANDYKERRDSYRCAIEELPSAKDTLLSVWMDKVIAINSLEDIRQVMSYLDNGSECYKRGIKKIIEIYKG